jgi:hypothetical protein
MDLLVRIYLQIELGLSILDQFLSIQRGRIQELPFLKREHLLRISRVVHLLDYHQLIFDNQVTI